MKIYIMILSNPQYPLMISGSLYLLPYIIYPLPVYVICMHNTLVFTTFLFWGGGAKKGTIVHRCDALVARTVFLYWVVTGFGTEKRKDIMGGLIVIFLIFFYWSNYYSSRDWLCKKHLYNHMGIHLTGLIYIFYCLF
jgi:hypothetical protein